jgi:hypothetical protein
MLIAHSNVDFNPNALRVLRAVRAIRVLKHSKSKTGMLFMIETLMLSLPAVLSVGLFMVS